MSLEHSRVNTGCCTSRRVVPVVPTALHAFPTRIRGHTRLPISFRGSTGVPFTQRCHRLSAVHVATTGEHAALIAELIDFLREDLQHLFDDQGIDESRYSKNVIFEDPITKHNNLQGYLKNIRFLRYVFDPSFTLLDVRQTGALEITTRWSMTMRPTFPKLIPGLQRYWNPVLIFTGTSILEIEPKTGAFTSHKDTWDAVENQRYFSVEAFRHVLNQLCNVQHAPIGLESPPYSVLLKRADYEVRQYEPFLVAETSTTASSGSGSQDAFRMLAGYIFGQNTSKKAIPMTTPVFSTKDTMRFYIAASGTAENTPLPGSPDVRLQTCEGGIYVVASLVMNDGVISMDAARSLALKLGGEARKDGLPVIPDNWILAQYNGPSTPLPFRKNEVFVGVDENEFKLW